MPDTGNSRKSFLILSWASYDLANQFFALNVVSLYFVRWLTLDKGAPEIFYSLAFGISTFFVAMLAPILGTIADVKGRHRPALICFTLLCIVFTMLLGFTQSIWWALIFFGIANLGCQEAIIFYNALMLNICPKDKVGFVSGLGKMFGYCGAIIALLLFKPIIVEKGYQATFLLTGILFFIFSLPCLIFVKDKPAQKNISVKYFLDKKRIVEIFKRLKMSLFETTEFAEVRQFLKAAFFGLCVVHVIMLFMSIYATKVYGLTDVEIINFIAFCTVFALLGSIFSGIISDIIGYRRAMTGVFYLWIISLLGGGILKPPFHWGIGALAGISLGSTWVVSRALIINIMPREKAGEVFGLFNLVVYASGIAGPIIWGLILLLLSDLGAIGYRIALLCFIPFMGIGIIYLKRIPNYRSRRRADSNS